MSNDAPLWRRYLRFLRPDVDADVDEELGFHLEMRAQEYQARGVPAEEARRLARARFGDVAGVARWLRHHDRRRAGARQRRETVDEIRRDARYALRTLGRRRGFTAVVVLTLALGIGLTSALFSVVDAVLLRPLPYHEADRLVVLWQHDRNAGNARDGVAPGNFIDWREQATGFTAMAAAEPYALDYLGQDGPETFKAWRVSEDFFGALGTPPLFGRTLRADDFTRGRDRLIVLGHAFWRRRFSGDASIVGRAVTLDGEPYVVVGVMPRAFGFPSQKDLWIPRVASRDGTDDRQNRRGKYLTVVGRLEPGVTIAQAQAALSAVARRLAAEYPRTNQAVDATVVPLREQVVGAARPALLVLLSAVALVLAVACANVANLFLAQALRRQREFAVRAALGAAGTHLARQVLAEAALLAAAGGAVGVAVAGATLGAIRALAPANLPRLDEIALDTRALAFTAGVAALTALAFASVPAWRVAHADPQQTLRGGDRGATAGAGRGRSRRALVVAEVALACVLVVGAGLLVRSFAALTSVERGYHTDHVLAISAFIFDVAQTDEKRAAFVRDVGDRLARLPGVRAVGVASALPLAERIGPEAATIGVEGRPPAPGAEPSVRAAIVTAGYFDALRIPLRRGRLFAATDDGGSVPVAVINERLAREFFPGEDPVGKRLVVRFAGPPVTREIVGVVGDVRHAGLDDEPEPGLYVAHAQAPSGRVIFVLRTKGDPAAMTRAASEQIRAVAPALPLYGVYTLDGLLDASLKPRRFNLLLLGAFSLAALALAAVGVFGVMSSATAERTREIGVRLALGARPGEVLRLVLREGAALAALGLAAGAALSLVAGRFLRALLFGVQPLDPVAFAAGAILILTAALVATLVPAYRAARVDPVIALRGE
jgi:putative ABC transport system permease protein